MLRVAIDLVPYGREEERRTLQTLTITNVGGTPQRGDYACLLSDENGLFVARAAVTDWPRLERDAAALVAEALREMGR